MIRRGLRLYLLPALGALSIAVCAACAACAHDRRDGAEPARAAPAAAVASPSPGVNASARSHLADVRQLTFGGENAEAYWSWDSRSLIFQARGPGEACDRIFRMDLRQSPPVPIPVSGGEGATTCSFYLPGDREILYASTHLAGAACPPRPDRSRGYVWAIYPTYDIFRADLDAPNPHRLTDAPGYDAEATVCAKDGSIVFTSVRDGDLELYRMKADGSGQKRLTNAVGYDGGAFFSPDCSKIVWRAARPSTPEEVADYKRLLGQNLVRPTKLEIWVANADGSDARQITYLDAASFAPSFFPSGQRIIFSSNTGDPQGREFDLWAVDLDGGNLERITTEPGFDGFPMFSPDGAALAFSSNRATPPGAHDTNVFVARWVDSIDGSGTAARAADRIAADVTWLADPARQGRGVGTAGLDAAGTYLETRMKALGLAPAGEDGGYRQAFSVGVETAVVAASLSLDGAAVAAEQIRPARFSSSATASGPLVFADYGIVDDALKVDDYRGIKAKGSIVAVRRFVPPGGPFEATVAQRTHGDLRKKAWLARERGAKALLVVDAPRGGAPDATEAPFPALASEGADDAGLPILFIRRAALAPILAKLEAGRPVRAELEVRLAHKTAPAFNVVGRVSSDAPAEKRLSGVVVVGAHYDHLGMGGRHSLAPDSTAPHLGADDNASGTAAVLEIARSLAARRHELTRDVVVVAFSGEEEGVLGSTAFTRRPPGGLRMEDVVAMVNFDMVGRMRDNHVDVLGAKSALEWPPLIEDACRAARVRCTPGTDDGLGPSDQMPFYVAGTPVVHFFTGVHADYHKPSDAPSAINAAGAGAVAEAGAGLVLAVAARPGHLSYERLPVPPRESDMRSFNASLGTIPDYAGPPGGAKGVLLAGVRPGSAAEKAGLKRGDILVRLGRHSIGDVQDFSFVLNASKPGETVTAAVLRDGREVALSVTFEEGKRR